MAAALGNQVLVWNAETGEEILKFRAHPGGEWMTDMAASPDGQRIATCSDDGTARVWDASNGKQLVVFKGHSQPVYSVRFSPDGRRIVSGGRDHTARVWDSLSGEELRVLRGHSSQVYATYSADGRRIITTGGDGAVKVWDAITEAGTIQAHAGRVLALAPSPDGQRLASGGADGTVKIWDMAGRKELARFRVATNLDSLTFACSADGKRLAASGSRRGTNAGGVTVWDLPAAKELFSLGSERSEAIRSVALSPNHQFIATLTSSSRTTPGSAQLWDAASGKELFTLRRYTNGQIAIAFSPDGQRVATSSLDGTVRVWESASGTELLTFKTQTPTNGAQLLRFSPDGNLLLHTSGVTIKIWDSRSGTEFTTLQGISPVMSIEFSQDGRQPLRFHPRVGGRHAAASRGVGCGGESRLCCHPSCGADGIRVTVAVRLAPHESGLVRESLL